MDWIDLRSRAVSFIDKYKFALLILVIGLCLMLLPSREEKQEYSQPSASELEEVTIEMRLCELLNQIQGAGKVQVLLTCSAGEEILYQTDGDISSTDTSYSEKSDTVIITDTDRAQQGLVRQINPPKYLGAVVICQGADSSSVRLAVVEAVSKATGLGADKIAVLKMK